MTILRIDNALAGGMRCPNCRKYDTQESVRVEIIWKPRLLVRTHTKCDECGQKQCFQYEPDRGLKYDFDTDCYRSVRLDKKR